VASLSSIIQDNKFREEDLPEFESQLFFEGDRTQRYIVRFTILLFLSTVIATQGIIEDSTATVIGAMIIAPLMTPIVATTAALMMGNAHRAWKSLTLVIAGVIGVILVSCFFGYLGIHVVDFDTNSQITARTVPRILDLIIALAAGTAAAFAMSRDDVADSIPGVAISIALVPPLCVVGIALSAAEWSDALGALLLFLTNFLSILLAGGAVFALLGLGAAVTKEMSHVNKGRAYRMITLGILLVTVPLAVSTIKVGRDSIAQVKITNIVNEWVSQYPGDIVIRSVLVSGDTAKILITGAVEPPTIEDLGKQIQSEVEYVIEIDLRYLPSSCYKFP